MRVSGSRRCYLSLPAIGKDRLQYRAPAAKAKKRHPNTPTAIQTFPLSWELNSDGMSKMSTAPDNAAPKMHVTNGQALLIVTSLEDASDGLDA